MANTAVMTASGVVKAASGNVYNVNITKVGTGSSAWTLYDNPSAASGRVIASGDGLTAQSFSLQGPSAGTQATQGLYLQLAGTTNPTVVVVYE